MKLQKLAGATSEIWQIFVRDSSSTTGAGLTGLTNASASLTAYYHRDTDTTATVINLVTMTVGTFTSSGFKEIDATNMPGWYQFCPPNAAIAAGAKSCAIHLKGATNMAPLPIEVQLVAVNPDSATAFITGVNSLAPPTNWNALGITAGGHVSNVDTLTTYTGNTPQTGDGFARLGAPAGASVSADIAAVKSDTGTILTDVNTGAGAIYTRIGAPAGASIAADIAAVEANAVGIKVKTDALSIDGSGNVSITSNIKKNSARAGFMLVMTDSTNHVPTAGLTVSATRSIDGAAFAGTTNSVTGVANGIYTIDLSAADVNGNHIMLRFTAVGADDLNIEIVTQP